MKVKINIDGQEDRRKIASILADNGISVAIEKEKKTLCPDSYYIIFEATEIKE